MLGAFFGTASLNKRFCKFNLKEIQSDSMLLCVQQRIQAKANGHNFTFSKLPPHSTELFCSRRGKNCWAFK